MAARLNPRHQDMVREKIRASQLINRLMDHALGEVDMSATQVRAAEALLKKCLPDLKSSDDRITHEAGDSVREVIKQYVSTSE